MASGAGRFPGSFEAVLSSLRPKYDAGGEAGAGCKPFAAPFLPAGNHRVCGFAAVAETAFEDFAPASLRSEPSKPLPSDAPDAIASELALGEIADPARLRSLRRRFLWANHPDRRPDIPTGLANRRVAIANMLIDRALKTNPPRGR